MIAYIEGKLAHKDPTFVVVDVQGIGYHIRVSLHTFSQLKDLERVKIHTFLHIKEDAHTLFGFADLMEKEMFLHLTSISGIGPGTALVVLSSMNPIELKEAIAREDVKTIQSVKGIGLKTAQRVILELKDKMKKDALLAGSDSKQNFSVSHNSIRSEALTALITLGFTKTVAEKNLDLILKGNSNSFTLEDLIKQALKMS
ncbi:Holliday junction branch migration protein RuvA [Cytophaga hutchinsonii]|jgi:Holliday junction DNA helicase RuvA|uniref:Holliday junction branch migration complex subunit RuvA n=1 Tax=Cytophaga hutchinsonii (strain ATCC 33406 / DSM 1761 / CIP 103989 / NBRC 15051 / NCIMB 9469 / D465) TaxID=269798 RepID=RUVA_CYTH3|nr:Holliday junction branch migration protein RuvA [Cytophaga hutchinsonii]Q11Z44.1 RecName: Full=Holliday junction branch migration complex subunit RuvA [Cytophaga hutchinsonii ATCC 33406]ABG57322.1 Holliday junction DNA helicase subunit RuvA [Cytophaga hutchinsonii ATCC 33406]SFX46334.1 Holliday junction DNA helicase subunit RuvA [Cytophaga hutchinsonii ATCC 33406]